VKGVEATGGSREGGRDGGGGLNGGSSRRPLAHLRKVYGEGIQFEKMVLAIMIHEKHKQGYHWLAALKEKDRKGERAKGTVLSYSPLFPGLCFPLTHQKINHILYTL
jgi:hypothetical protein